MVVAKGKLFRNFTDRQVGIFQQRLRVRQLLLHKILVRGNAVFFPEPADRMGFGAKQPFAQLVEGNMVTVQLVNLAFEPAGDAVGRHILAHPPGNGLYNRQENMCAFVRYHITRPGGANRVKKPEKQL